MGLAKMLPELIQSLFHKPATIRFPAERVPAPEGLRGKPVCDFSLCIGCRACARDCPAMAIEMADVGEKLPKPVFHYDRCAFCGQCADSCPKKAITMTREYDLASFSRAGLTSRAREGSQRQEVADS